MRKEIKFEGSAFTRHRNEIERSETEEEFEQLGRETHRLRHRPWTEGRKEQLAWVEQQLAREMTGRDRPDFEPRKAVGWYLIELNRAANGVRDNSELGNAEYVASWASRWGELWAELQLKIGREELYLAGLNQVRNGQASRRGDDRETRIAAVKALVAAGWKVTAAFSKVAETQGVKAKAVEADYYGRKKKRPTAHD